MSDKLLKQIIANQESASLERHDHGQKLDKMYRLMLGEPEAPENGLLHRVRVLEGFKTWALRIFGFGVLGGGSTTAWWTTAKSSVEAVASGKLPGTH